MAAIDRLEGGATTDALALLVAGTDRSGLTRSTTRAEGTSEAGVLVTDVFAGADGRPWSSSDPIRLPRSHVEKGAVNGDKIRTISQLAAIFVGIGSDCACSKKSATPRAIWREKMRTKSRKTLTGSQHPININV